MARLLWTQIQDIGPVRRVFHAMAYDVKRARVVLFGGTRRDTPNSQPIVFGDTWEWDGDTWMQVAHLGPGPRQGHVMTYDRARSRLVLFGGVGRDSTNGQERYYDDTWEWDGTAWTQVADMGPAPRWRAAIAFDEARSRTVLFGGEPGSGQAIDDSTWEWDGTHWTEAANAGPPYTSNQAMVYEKSRNRIVLRGASPTTFAWNGQAWTTLSDMGPAGMVGLALAHDIARDKTILVSGVTYDRACDTWELDGDRWRQRQDMGPQGRFGHALAYDEARQRVVLFGGAFNPPAPTNGLPAGAEIPYADTWELAEHAP